MEIYPIVHTHTHKYYIFYITYISLQLTGI